MPEPGVGGTSGEWDTVWSTVEPGAGDGAGVGVLENRGALVTGAEPTVSAGRVTVDSVVVLLRRR